MSERTSSKTGIADYVVARRKRKESFLDEIDRLIDWKPLEKLLRKTLKRVTNAVGNPAYPPLPMFKILLLQRWYNLSDTAVEEALYDRFSFVRFVGLSLDHDEVPDATTICRFRQSHVERNVQKRLLDKLDHACPRNIWPDDVSAARLLKMSRPGIEEHVDTRGSSIYRLSLFRRGHCDRPAAIFTLFAMPANG